MAEGINSIIQQIKANARGFKSPKAFAKAILFHLGGLDMYPQFLPQCPIIKELEKSNQSAANSLKEGLEQTLTLHKLSVNVEFARSLSTTNCIENLNGTIQRKIRNNCKWKNSLHLLRWMAASCLDAEKKMRKIPGNKLIPILAKAIKKHIKKMKKSHRNFS